MFIARAASRWKMLLQRRASKPYVPITVMSWVFAPGSELCAQNRSCNHAARPRRVCLKSNPEYDLNPAFAQEDADENDELDAENAEGKLAWAGGREEAATYEPGDDEDSAAAAAARAQAERQAGDPPVRAPFPLLTVVCDRG